MQETNNQGQEPTDVAMFIDWENMHGGIRGKANISALREVAEGYGRLVLAKAYADWRERRFQQDSLVLYKIGFEPVYVPSGFKNNVDVKLATDCIDFAYKHPNIGVVILVTGDGDFIHVATTLRPLGKTVVVIAQSSNASNRLGDLVDTLLIYEEDVNPEANGGSVESSSPEQAKSPKKLEDVYQDIAAMIRKADGGTILLTNVKQRLIRQYGRFDQRDYSFEKFKAMMEQGEKKGYFVINTAGLRDWLTVPKNDTRDTNVELPDEVEEVFDEVARIIQTSTHPQTYLSSIKAELVKKYGGFDESVYGYGRFKELMEEGARQRHFELRMNDKQVDYAVVSQN